MTFLPDCTAEKVYKFFVKFSPFVLQKRFISFMLITSVNIMPDFSHTNDTRLPDSGKHVF